MGRLKPIFLLGMMGAGKSTVGRALASRRGVAFIDLDVRIERLFGRSIAALFEHGEAEFRACERQALRSLLAEPGFGDSGAVVATGGGIVGDPSNLDAIEAIGISVFLRAGIPTLVERLLHANERAGRPLLAGVDLHARLTALLAAREPAYASARSIVDGEAELETVLAAIEAALAQ